MDKYDIITICLICLLLFPIAEALGHPYKEENVSDKDTILDLSPIVSEPNPPHGSEGLNSTPELSVLVEHPEDSDMDVSFYDIDEELIAVVEDVADGDRAQVVWENRDPDSSYSWHVVASDGVSETEAGPWNFTTAGIDYVRITDEVNGTALTDKDVPPDYEEWGYLSTYNDTYGFFDTAIGEWEVSGDAELLGENFLDFNGINVGETPGDVWFNVTSDDPFAFGYQDSVRYTVITDEVDHIKITDSPGGEPLENETVEVGHQARGYCSAYNEEDEYLFTVSGDWSAVGADSSLLENSFNESNVIDVGHEGGTVWFNVSYEEFNDSVRLDVLDPEPDEINITDEPDGVPIEGGEVQVGYNTWGNASGYNSTTGYIGTVEVEWSVEYDEGMDPFMGPTPSESSWIDVGTSPGELFWNASYQKDGHWVNDSVQFIVVHGDAAYFEFEPIGTQTAGELFTITITTYDDEDNVVTDYKGTAELSDTTGTIEPETIEFTEGIVTEDVTITESHTEVTISAEDEYITGESDPFVVEPAEAVEFWIEPGEETITAGESQAYNAYAEDEYGNEFEVNDITWSDDVTEEASEWLDNEISVEKAGTWTITGEYGEFEDTATLVVEPAEAVEFWIEPGEETVTAGESQAYNAYAEDEYGNEFEVNDTTWSDDVDPEEASEWVNNEISVEKAGTWTITGEYGEFEDTATLVVEPAEAVEFWIEPGEETVTAGESQAYNAYAEDEYGNVFEVNDTTWSDDVTEEASEWVNNEISVEKAGTWTITGEYEEFEDTATLVVEPAEAVEFWIEPGEETITAGESQAYNAYAEDEYGNEFEVNDTIWSDDVDPEEASEWVDNEISVEKAGTWTITGEYGEFEDTATLVVEPAEAVEFWIEPGEETITAGESQAYNAYAEDEYGNEFEVNDTIWSDDVDPEEASEWVNNEITVEKAGTWTITGEYRTLTDTASLEVTPAEPDHFGFDLIYDQSAGVVFEIIIIAYDEYDNIAEGYEGTAYLTDTTGTIEPVETDAFTDGTWTGDVTITKAEENVVITATDDAITGNSNEFTVEPPKVDYIEITKDGEEFSGGSVPVNYTVGVELSVYNHTTGYIGSVEGDWDTHGGNAFLLNGTFGMENEINVGTVPGEVHLTAQYDDLMDEVVFNVQYPEIDYIRIIEDIEDPNSVIDSVTVSAGDEVEGHSAGFNESIGFVDLVETNWLVNNYEGAEGSTSPSHGNSSVFDAGPFGGESEWISEYEGYIIDTVEIQILPPSLDQLLIRSESDGGGEVLEYIELKIGGEISLFSAGYNDTFGYRGDLEAEWSLDDEEKGELTESQGKKTTFISLQPGTVEITAFYQGIEATVEVKILDDRVPEIIGEIPDLELERNFGIHEINLTEHASDEYDDISELKWYLTGKKSSVISTYGENLTGNHVITLLSKENAMGTMEVRYWLVNSAGNSVSQSAWINVTTAYDAPRIRRCPDLYVHYEKPYEFDYSPYIIYDRERFDELKLETDDPEHTSIHGLKVVYEYPEDMLGDEILVTITVSDDRENVSTTISVTVTSNSPPVKTEKLPDVTMDQGELKENVFDLDDYFMDPDGDPLYMSYGYTYLTITIHDDHTVDIRADSNWHGLERVTFRAKDPVGAIVEQTINVTVIPVNNPPEIKELPPLVVRYDEPYVFDLEYYIYDPDNETHELTITTGSPDYVEVDGTKLIMTYPKTKDGLEANYTVPLEIFVSDGIETTSEVTTVTVGSHYPPELVIPLHDVAFKENEQLINAFNLDNHFIDRQDDTMYYSSGNEYIEVVIHENNTVDFYAPKNWNGQELITIRATNSAGALMEDSLTVTVIPVNNPPEISDIPRQYGEVGRSWILDMGDYISDVDNETHELELFVENPYVEVYGHKLLFEYDQPGEYEVTVEVSDGIDTTIGIIEVYIEETEKEPWYSNNLVFLLGFIPLGLIGYFLYLKKKEYVIEDIFLIHDSGVLIKHITRTLKAERDEDILAGMFTAVQNFVDDAFAEEEDEVLKRMEYGNKKVLVHKGDSIILAVFISGDEPKWALEGMKNLVSDIEERYGENIKSWSGDRTDIPGITEMLKALYRGRGKYEPKDWKKYSED